jgi:tetratricopeptide (TPR) repeat protein
MATRRQRSQFDMSQNRKRPPWVLWTVVSIVFLAIFAFAVITFLVLKSQGITQAGVNTLTIISIIVSAVIGFLGLMISFLQWHHPKPSGTSETDPASLLQITSGSTLERSQPPISAFDPLQEQVSGNEIATTSVDHNSHPIYREEASHEELSTDVVRGIQTTIKDLNIPAVKSSESFPHTWNVPYPRNPYFTGCEDRLTELAASLKTNRTAGLAQPRAISGLGGIGKTQIAVEYAYRYHADYQVVLWARAETREALLSSFTMCAQLLDLPGKASPDQAIAVDAFIQWMRTHTQWLLILDNSDNLEVIKEFLPPTFGGHILLTTRAQAMGRLAQRIEVETMAPEIGALFLLRRATLIASDASLDQASASDREVALAIVRALGGLPLALDQAGAYLEETGASLLDYLHLYEEQKTALLNRRGGLITDHPEPVTTTWSISFQQVGQTNPSAADLLRFCAFLYPDMIPEEIIKEGLGSFASPLHSVVKNPLAFYEALKALSDYSFVQRDTTNHALSMHRLVQVIVRDEMSRKMYQQWAERAIRAVNAVFPVVEFTMWPRCGRYLSNAQECAKLIEPNAMKFPEAAHLLNKIGRYLHERGRYTEAEQPLKQALSIREQQLGLEHPDTATSLNNLGMLYYALGKYPETKALHTRALSIREQQLGLEHPDTATSLNNLGMLYFAQGKFKTAELLLEQALTIQERQLGLEGLATTRNLDNLGRLYYKMGKYAEAELLFKRIRVIRERFLGINHPDTASVLNNLGILYCEQGKYAEAEQLIRQALAIREQLLGFEHPTWAVNLDSLARLYDLQRKYTEAETLYLQALAVQERQLEPDHPNIAISLKYLANLYYTLGDYNRAEPLFERVLTIQVKRLGPEHPDTIDTLKNYALLLRTTQREAEAELLESRIPPVY